MAHFLTTNRTGLPAACLAAFVIAVPAAAQSTAPEPALAYESATAEGGADGAIEQAGWFGGCKCARPNCRCGRQWLICPPECMHPPCPAPVKPPTAPPTKPEAPKAPPEAPREAPPEAPAPTTPSEDMLAAGAATAAAAETVAPNMLGDFLGAIYQGRTEVIVEGQLSSLEIAEQRMLKRYKVADFTSPVPQTRILYSFNYFQDVFESTGDVRRNFFGFEYAFFDRMASIELKTAVDQFFNFPGEPEVTNFADLRTTLKAVIYQQRAFLFSGGLAIGWPTGPIPDNIDQSYYFSPFIGYLFASPDSPWYVQGFQQLDIPTDGDDQLLMHTDVGVGYWLRRNCDRGLLRGFAPVAELHLYTPIGDSPTGQLSNLVLNDVLNATLGCSLLLGNNVQVALGLGIPLSTNKDYDIEAQCHAQWAF